MADLGPLTVRTTYTRLLQASGDVSASGVRVETGGGVPLPLLVAASGVWFTGLVDLSAATVVGGTGGATYTHTQAVPAATWTIAHHLGRYPSVVVADSAGSVCVGEVTYQDADTITVAFSAAFAGAAYLN